MKKTREEILEEAIEKATAKLGVGPAYYGEEGLAEVSKQLEKMGYSNKDFDKGRIMKTVRTKLILDIETVLEDDPENDKGTVRYLVEQDLQDLGYTVHECEVKE